MKRTVTICDNCNNRIAKTKCELCGKDLCHSCSRSLVIYRASTEIRMKFQPLLSKESKEKYPSIICCESHNFGDIGTDDLDSFLETIKDTILISKL